MNKRRFTKGGVSSSMGRLLRIDSCVVSCRSVELSQVWGALGDGFENM